MLSALRFLSSSHPDAKPIRRALRRLLQPLLAALPCGLGLLAPALAQSDTSAQVIVKYRDQAGAAAPARRVQALGQRHGLELHDGQRLAEHTQVLRASGISPAELVRRLAADPNVEYVVEDQRRRALALPNDPLYGNNLAGVTPRAGQWYLRAPTATLPASIDIEPAWALTHGSSSVVVAVIDSGVRPEHPDLVGKLLPGYDFITDPVTANDGDGRDPDPSDPGDWVPDSVATQDCTAGDSLWHGTQMAGLIGASTGNGIGMAGIGRNVMVLPLRVLGRCGGVDSDILAAMRWAAGLSVPGLPVNPNPAQVINLSLGSHSACSSAYQSVLQELQQHNVVVVAATGNESREVTSPANCAGISGIRNVIAVGGLRHSGGKALYSNFGSEVTLSAPGGNCVSTSTCLYPILSTSDSGSTVPTRSGYTSGGIDYAVGTSYAAPLVSGTAALMLSANPALTSSALIDLLKRSTRAFPAPASGSAVCHQPDGSNQGECGCTTSTCGAGMLDAGAAVQAAASNVLVARISSDAGWHPDSGGTLSASVTLPTGHSVSSYAWSISAGADQARISGPIDSSQVSIQISGSGGFTVQLLVSDGSSATRVTETFNYVASPLALGLSATDSSSSGSSGDTGGGALQGGALLGLLLAAALLGRPRQR